MSTQPLRFDSRTLDPRHQLRGDLRRLADSFMEHPRTEPSTLAPVVLDLIARLRGLPVPHGLPHLVLQNLLTDLRRGDILDAGYHAAQLGRAADQLDP